MAKRGRPQKFEKQRGSLTIRLRDEVRKDLEAAASEAGRSLSEEVEYRLELAFHDRDQIVEKWGDDVFNLAESAWRALWHIERHTGKRWAADERTYQIFQATVAQLIRNYRDLILRQRRGTPEGDFEGKSDQELAEMFAGLGGISPPQPRPHGTDNPERDAADRADSIRKWKDALDAVNARPLPPHATDGSLKGEES